MKRICMVLAALGLVLTGACSSLSDRPVLTVEEEAVVRAVQQRLLEDSVTRPFSFSVTGLGDGVVSVGGVVSSDSIRARALGVVATTPGVTEAVDRIILQIAP